LIKGAESGEKSSGFFKISQNFLAGLVTIRLT